MASSGCRKWMVLAAAIWIQAFTGTNFDFPSYSTQIKSILEINQVQLNYLAMASDIGKLFGWCSGVLLLYFPTWVVLFMASFLGLFGYGLQWLVIQGQISLPYIMVFVLSLSAGGSIPWFNTVCFVLNIRNFPENWPLAVSLSVSFNGVTAALYNLIATKLSPTDKTTSYLILNALVPLLTSVASLGPILQQPISRKDNNQKEETILKDDAHIFVFLYILAAITGLYLFFLNPKSQSILVVTMLLIVLPFIIPIIIYLVKRVYRGFCSDGPIEGPNYALVEIKHQEEFHEERFNPMVNKSPCGCSVFDKMIKMDRLRELGEEHSTTYMMRRCDFWLYYVTYFCGGTIGLVYSNNLGQIAQSLGYISDTKALVTIYSTCSFFGRLLSAAMDLVGCFYQQTSTSMYATRTGRLVIALLPMPVAFLMLVFSGAKMILSASSGIIGICSGFLISTAVSITSELFGPKSSGINHNILITNIPLGSLLYGVLAALIYVDNIDSDDGGRIKVCIGRDCYHETFLLWGLISLVGVCSSFLLFVRTKAAYESYYKRKNWIPGETV